MLEKEETATKLARALAAGFATWAERQFDENQPSTKAEFARQCGALAGRTCSPQTVASWFKTGRMDKSWLPVVEEVLGVSLGFGRAIQSPVSGVALDMSQARNSESPPKIR